jgi:hypothetical protein
MHILKILIVLAVPALAGCKTLEGEISIDATPLGFTQKIAQTMGTPGAVCVYDKHGENPVCVAGNGAGTEVLGSAVHATGVVVGGVLTPAPVVTAIAVANVSSTAVVNN